MSRRGVDHHFLAEWNYTAATRKKNIKAANQFLQWCANNGEDFHTYEELDDLFVDFMHQLYLDGGGKSTAKNALYGVIMFEPRARDQLMCSRMCLRGWMKRSPPVSYPPLTWEVTVVIAVQLIRSDRFLFGVATLLGFDCLLRVSELMNLVREDVVHTGDARMGSVFRGMLLRIRKAKTGRNQLVEVSRPAVRELILQVLSITQPRCTLFGATPDTFRKHFKATCLQLGLSASYVPHSLRHGGATWLHMNGMSVEDILLRGRWASTKSARTYLQAGRAMLMSVNVPQTVHNAGVIFSRDVVKSVTLAQMH